MTDSEKLERIAEIDGHGDDRPLPDYTGNLLLCCDLLDRFCNRAPDIYTRLRSMRGPGWVLEIYKGNRILADAYGETRQEAIMNAVIEAAETLKGE